jgi:hypothetical protein
MNIVSNTLPMFSFQINGFAL